MESERCSVVNKAEGVKEFYQGTSCFTIYRTSKNHYYCIFFYFLYDRKIMQLFFIVIICLLTHWFPVFVNESF